MIINFKDKATHDIYHGISSKASRTIPQSIWEIAIRKMDMINAAYELKDLKVPPANKLEKLKGKLKDLYSIRINDQFRIIFQWNNHNSENVQIIDYH